MARNKDGGRAAAGRGTSDARHIPSGQLLAFSPPDACLHRSGMIASDVERRRRPGVWNTHCNKTVQHVALWRHTEADPGAVNGQHAHLCDDQAFELASATGVADIPHRPKHDPPRAPDRPLHVPPHSRVCNSATERRRIDGPREGRR